MALDRLPAANDQRKAGFAGFARRHHCANASGSGQNSNLRAQQFIRVINFAQHLGGLLAGGTANSHGAKSSVSIVTRRVILAAWSFLSSSRPDSSAINHSVNGVLLTGFSFIIAIISSIPLFTKLDGHSNVGRHRGPQIQLLFLLPMRPAPAPWKCVARRWPGRRPGPVGRVSGRPPEILLVLPVRQRNRLANAVRFVFPMEDGDYPRFMPGRSATFNRTGRMTSRVSRLLSSVYEMSDNRLISPSRNRVAQGMRSERHTRWRISRKGSQIPRVSHSRRRLERSTLRGCSFALTEETLRAAGINKLSENPVV